MVVVWNKSLFIYSGPRSVVLCRKCSIYTHLSTLTFVHFSFKMLNDVGMEVPKSVVKKEASMQQTGYDGMQQR